MFLYKSMKTFVKHVAMFCSMLSTLVAIVFASSAVALPLSESRVLLGQQIFADASLSSDGKVRCQSCHIPAKAYADPRRTSVGVHGRSGTRNAPSLIGIADDDAFLWDGRRNRLEDVVMDPFTNPVELGLSSIDELMSRLGSKPATIELFRQAFPSASSVPTREQTGIALASFVRSLSSPADELATPLQATSGSVALGKQLFEGVAGCAECHSGGQGRERFTDGKYHHSSVSPPTLNNELPALTTAVVREALDADAIGPRVLTDSQWSSLGRFVVTRRPSDIAAYRTPSLLNVAQTAPYMHDGSIASLQAAVDRELFYRSFSRGHPVNLSATERKAITAYLELLVESPSVPSGE